MSYQLGIDLGTTYSAAAVAESGNAEIFQLGTSMASVPSVVLLREDGTVLTGEAAQRRSLSESNRTAREFKRRLGDPTPYLLGGTPYGVEALTGHLMASIVDRVVTERGKSPDAVVLAHPAAYGPYKLGFLADAARLAGVGEVRFVAEPVAAAVYYSQTERVAHGDLIGVYDFGGGTLDLAVVRKTPTGFEVVGTPEGMERFGGVDLDEAVFGYVDEALGGIVSASDPNDGPTVAAIIALRTSCREAKEALSTDTDVTIPVMLPSLHTEVRLTRGEFEDMIRPRLRETMSALERTVRSAGVSYDDLARILLVGGASRIPLVAEMVRDTTGRPVAVDAHPKHAIALGAALVPPDQEAPAAVAPVPKPAEEDESALPPDEPEPVPLPEEYVSAIPVEEAEFGVVEESEPVVGAASDETSRPSRRRLYAVLGVVAALIVAIGGLLLLSNGAEQPEASEAVASTEAGGPTESDPAVAISERVAAVYRVGYRSVDIDGEWGDWSIGDNHAPDDPASDFMPALGLYSSSDPAIRNEHFEMLKTSSVGVVLVIWRGPESLDDALMPAVLDEAEARGLTVAFGVSVSEEDGTAESILGDIEYLAAAYGDHPAVFRPGDPSPWTPEARILVSVVGVQALEIVRWTDTLDAIHEIDGGVIVLAVSSDREWVEVAHFDGLVSGPFGPDDPISYEWVEGIPDDAWFVPVVSPGSSMEWEQGLGDHVPRDGGTRYEQMWMAATSTSRDPNLVLVLSFNEWHAGTQIEPADPDAVRPDGSPYQGYVPVSPEGYLDLTRTAVERWAGS